jgi:hypothetical protein
VTRSAGRLSAGEMIAGLSAILLSYFMFFDWFGEEASQEPSLNLPSVGHSAWDALNYIPIVLLIAIVAALAVAALPTNAVRKLPVSAHEVVALLGIVSALLILLRIFDPPNFGSEETLFGTVKYEGTVQFPIFLALVAATGIAVGG